MKKRQYLIFTGNSREGDRCDKIRMDKYGVWGRLMKESPWESRTWYFYPWLTIRLIDKFRM